MGRLAAQAHAAKESGVPLADMCAQLLAAVAVRRDDAAVLAFRPVARDGG
jgi:hypothetical protein